MGTNSDENHDIDRKAVNYVESILTGKYWELLRLEPDVVGIDRKCVLRGADRQPTHNAYIQIRGRGVQRMRGKAVPLVGSGGFVSQHIEIEHLDYYMKLSVPVFLVVVDVSKKRKVAYWLFVQKYICEKLNDQDWRLPLRKFRSRELKQKPKLGVRVPATNRLDDFEKLKAAVKRAEGYMASLNINRGINHEIEELCSLDPRFEIDLTVAKGQKSFQIKAKEPVQLKFQGKLRKEKFDNFFWRGLPITVQPGEIIVEGSSLFGRRSSAMYRIIEDNFNSRGGSKAL